jgi:hypothetical protein
MKMPAELKKAAMSADDSLEAALMTEIPAPRRPFSGKVMKNLLDAAAKASMVFGAPVRLEISDAPAARLPGDVVRVLAMMEKAAEDYGDPFPVSLKSAVTDEALVAIAAHLLSLSRDPEFKKFLQEEPAMPEEEMGEEELPVEEMAEEEMPEEDTFEFERTEQEDDGEIEETEADLFRKRMKR